MSKKLVTSAQVESLRTMANAKGVGRDEFQVWLDKHAGKILDDMKNEVTGIVPLEGARTYTVSIKYRSTGIIGDIEEDIILLNYPSGGSLDRALIWAQGAKLKNTVPSQVFTIGEQYPDLHCKLGLNLSCVVATTIDDNRRLACWGWWNGSVRGPNLYRSSDFGGSNDWFAFCK